MRPPRVRILRQKDRVIGTVSRECCTQLLILRFGKSCLPSIEPFLLTIMFGSKFFKGAAQRRCHCPLDIKVAVLDVTEPTKEVLEEIRRQIREYTGCGLPPSVPFLAQ